MNNRRQIVAGIAAAGSIVAVSAGLAVADAAGLIGGDLAVRGSMVVIGLVCLVGYANFTPKTGRSTAPTAHQQGAMRFYGWAMTFAGLAWVALWAFAPVELASIAAPAGVVAVLVAWIAICARGKSGGDAARL